MQLSDDRQATLQALQEAAHEYVSHIIELVPEGADKTYLMRKFHEVTMWVQVAVSREVHAEKREG
jgi:hypothetical protein